MRHTGFLILAALFLAASLRCQSISTANYTTTQVEVKGQKRVVTENCRNFVIEAGDGTFKVSLFPRTYNTLVGPEYSLLLVSPVLLSDEVLYDSGSSSIIPWFNSRGVSVWLVRIPPQTPLDKFGREVLPEINVAIRKNSKDRNWVLGGVSLGGQAIAHYLHDAPKHELNTQMRVHSAFFLGTGFDYEYPGAFGRILAKENMTPAEFQRRFAPGIKLEHIASRANLFVGGKPVWSDALSGINLKDKGVRVLFLAGKIDDVAPSESVYKFFVKTAGSEIRNVPGVLFMQPGRMNRHSINFDHGSMVASPELAADILPEIFEWLDI
jgi:poly(3-hydroxyalkanoate) synthetase